MISLRDTAAGEALEQRFAGIQDDTLRDLLRSRLVGATNVLHTLVLREPGDAGSTDVRFIDLVANCGVEGDRRAGGLTPIDISHEPVLAHICGMLGKSTLNDAQVVVTDFAESMRVATRLGVGHIPIGIQAENIVLGSVASEVHGISGVSRLSPGMVITFMEPRRGVMRLASLHVVGNAAPNPGADAVLRRVFEGANIVAPYGAAAQGTCGINAMVKTPGVVARGDIALIWLRA